MVKYMKEQCIGCHTPMIDGECPNCGFDATEVDIY